MHLYTHRVDFLTAPDGTPVNAVFGFMRTLLKIMKDFDYDYIGTSPRHHVPLLSDSQYSY